MNMDHLTESYDPRLIEFARTLTEVIQKQKQEPCIYCHLGGRVCVVCELNQGKPK